MKVALVFPPPPAKLSVLEREVMSVTPPLGIAYIGAYLEKLGHEVKLIDGTACSLGLREVVAEVRKFGPRFVGITAFTPVALESYALADALKAELPQTPVALGGPHPTILAEDCLLRSKTDFAVIGEGEVTVAELLTFLQEGREGLDEIDGIAFRRDGEVVVTRRRKLLADLDQLPFPARHLLPMGRYRLAPHYYRKLPATPLITSRGCPFHCIFCDVGVFGNRFRARSPENIVEEFERLIAEFGIRDFLLWDDTFTFDAERVSRFCALLRKMRKKVIWGCISRVDRVDEKLLQEMKKAGCHYIGYGIEAGSPRILESVRKGITLEKVRRAVQTTKKVGIDIHGYFMLGLPGETVEDIRMTIQLAIELNTDFVTFTITTPYPGTELWQIAERDGLLLTDDWAKFARQSDEPAYAPNDVPAAELVRLLRHAYRSYYYRPRYILSQLAGIRSPEDVARMWRALKGLSRT